MSDLHLAATATMTGVIWMVQLLIYPSFKDISETDFVRFHAHHGQKITWVVGPVMLIEMITATILAYQNPNIFWIANLVGVVLLWLSTGLLSVPCHNRLGREGKQINVISRLIATNWPRTFGWTARTIALLTYFTFRPGV